jgi:uncharacterized protein
MKLSLRSKPLDQVYGLDAGRPRGPLAAILALLLRHNGIIFIVMMLVTALGGYLATKLPLVTDFAQLIPQDTRSVRDANAGHEHLGNTSLLVALIEAPKPRAGHLDNPDGSAGAPARQAAALLAERLERDPEFTRVLYRFNREFFEHNALLYMTVEQLEDLHQRLDRRITREVLDANPLFVDLDDDLDDDEAEDVDGEPGKEAEPDIFDPDTLQELYGNDDLEMDLREYLVDDQGTTYLVIAQPQKPAVDMSYNRFVMERAQQYIDELDLQTQFGVSITLAGNYRSALEENDSVRRDLGRAGFISFVLLLLAIVLYFRRLRASWTIFVPLLSGVVIMMGYVQLAVGRLNTITGFCFALFMGLSIDFAIHMLARYDEERGQGKSVFDALLVTYRHTGRAALAAGFTSSAGFLALAVADFKGLHEFGVIAGGGILICLLVIAIELPVVIALSLRFARESRFVPLNLDRVLVRRTPPYGRMALVALIALALLAERARHVEWEDDFRKLRGGPAETLEITRRVEFILGRSTQPAVRIADSMDEAAKLARACNDERDQRGTSSTVHVCASLADFVPDDQPEKLRVIARIKGLLTDNRLQALDDEPRAKLTELRDNAPTRPITVDDLPEEIRVGFISDTGDKYFMKAYPAVQFWLVRNNVRFADELMAGDEVSSTDIGPIGTAMIMADLMRVMEHDSVVVVALAFCVVLLVLLLLFRSIPRALAAYVPLVAGLVATAGLMALLDVPLDFYNMIVIPSLIGIGVDTNIHILHRYHVEGRGSWRFVINTTGSACGMAAVTTMIGFVGLLFAGHLGLRSIGTLALLGITTCTLVSVIVVPAVLGWLETRVAGTAWGLLPGHAFVPPNHEGKDDASLS